LLRSTSAALSPAFDFTSAALSPAFTPKRAIPEISFPPLEVLYLTSESLFILLDRRLTSRSVGNPITQIKPISIRL
jgi:hypothetical protein